MTQIGRFLLMVYGLVLGAQSFAEAKDIPVVAVSVKPLALLVGALCGLECKSVAFIPDDGSEHHWEPTPKDLLLFKAAKAGVGIGLDFDDRHFKRLTPGLTAGKGLLLIGKNLRPKPWAASGKGHHHTDHNHDHDHGHWDPHLWFDPVRMADAVAMIVDLLSQRLPESAGKFKSQGESLVKSLRALDAEILLAKERWPRKTIIVFHDALGYWGERYQQDIRPLVGAGSGREVSAYNFGKLIKEFKGKSVAAIVVEKPDGTATNLARDLKTNVVTLDFSARLEPASYEAWLRQFARQWEQVVR